MDRRIHSHRRLYEFLSKALLPISSISTRYKPQKGEHSKGSYEKRFNSEVCICVYFRLASSLILANGLMV